MATIDRTRLKYDEKFAAYRGRLVIDGRKFDAVIRVPEKRPERAWAVAEKAIDLVLNRFPAVEREIEKGLAARLVYRFEKDVEVREIARRVVEAMGATKVVAVHADHESASLYFNAPRFVRGHKIAVTLAKGGRLYVGLAG